MKKFYAIPQGLMEELSVDGMSSIVGGHISEPIETINNGTGCGCTVNK